MAGSTIFKSTNPVGLNKVDQQLASTVVGGGLKDGSKTDDIVYTKVVEKTPVDLKPSQSDIAEQEIISLIVYFLDTQKHKKENTGIIISKDDFVVDGHHRWLAIMLIDPNQSITVTQINLDASSLITALNIVTKGKFGIKNGNKGTCKLSRFDESMIGKLLQQAYTEGIPGKHPKSPELVRRVLGGDIEQAKQRLLDNLELMKKTSLPGALVRKEMPVVGKKNVEKVANLFNKGVLDLNYPFSDAVSKNLEEMVNRSELNKIEKKADSELNPIDVEFTNHFSNRVNDPRNRKEISASELERFFEKLANNKERFISFLKRYYEVVVKDPATSINIPFAKKLNKLFAKTIMRKPDFYSPDPIFMVSEVIKKVNSKWAVYPEKGGKRLGTHDTRKQAEKQLQAIHLNKEEKIQGGLADNLKVVDLAKQHKVDTNTIVGQIQKGIKVELEHTDDIFTALEITMDHVFENPNYYTDLQKIE